MTTSTDPYRILGIPPGASLNEVRSAYRRLVKQYHPDAAGERALPRFLAIQAAYERLVDGEGRLRMTRRAAGGATPQGAEGRSARAHGARAPGTATPGASGTAEAGTDRPGAPGTPGTDGARTQGRAAPGASPGGTGTTGRRHGPREGGPDSRGSRQGGRDAAGSRKGTDPPRARAARKATPGSTTYDEAAETPLDPPWDGGAWYGPSSGTFWTLNPREYADPRKHGPEYEARARRALRRNRAGTPEPGP
jgi:curved DNA-binding protein CbpA